jgi:hypothetical protein
MTLMMRKSLEEGNCDDDASVTVINASDSDDAVVYVTNCCMCHHS